MVKKDEKVAVYKLKSNYHSIYPKIPNFEVTLETLTAKDIYGLKKDGSASYEDKKSEEGFYGNVEVLLRAKVKVVLHYEMIDFKTKKPVEQIVEINSKDELDKFYENVLKPSRLDKK